MSQDTHHNLRAQVLMVLIIQFAALMAIVVIISVVALANEQAPTSRWLLSSVYGTCLAMLATVLNARSVARSTRGTSVSLAPVIPGLLLKMLLIGSAIAAGLIFFDLLAIPLVISFLVVQYSSILAL